MTYSRAYLIDIWDNVLTYRSREPDLRIRISTGNYPCISSWGNGHWVDNYQLAVL